MSVNGRADVNAGLTTVLNDEQLELENSRRVEGDQFLTKQISRVTAATPYSFEPVFC
jgi:hypothetical protein